MPVYSIIKLLKLLFKDFIKFESSNSISVRLNSLTFIKLLILFFGLNDDGTAS